VSRSSTVVAARSQVSCDLDGEAAILHLESGVYYGLNPVGAWIWNLIQRPMTVDEIRRAILKRYDVEPDLCERDLHTLLQDLAAADLIEIRDAPAP
jgi:coenzyme PQQ synthesis protein D (PqqD)